MNTNFKRVITLEIRKLYFFIFLYIFKEFTLKYQQGYLFEALKLQNVIAKRK